LPRAKQRTPQLRDRVLQVAVATLAGEGISGFTTRKVAQGAGTSIPAVYELFGDRAGLVREMFFEGFRLLRRGFDRLEDTGDPRADLLRVFESIRSFVRDHPVLAEVMFSRPFSDFDPGREELAAGSSVRDFIVGHVRRCIDAGILAGDETDLSHVLMALTQGLASQEVAGWLGTSQESRDRRWTLAFRAVLDGAAPVAAGRASGQDRTS
jgi:AcrR family transcriptional regulator